MNRSTGTIYLFLLSVVHFMAVSPVYAIPQAAMSVKSGPAIDTVSNGPIAGEYDLTEEVIDLEVKVLGGRVQVRRKWQNGGWEFMPRLRDLVPLVSGRTVAGGFDALGPDDNPDSIRRGRVVYEKVDEEDPARWQADDRRRIVSTETGFRWENRSGQWVAFDKNGRSIAYGGRNDVRIGITRDTDGRIEGLVDHHGNVAFSLDYNGQGMVVRAEGRAGRSVAYEWTDGRLTAVTDVLGRRWQYRYTELVGLMRLTGKTDPEGRSTTYRYAVIGGTTGCVPTGRGHWDRDNSGSLEWTGRCVQKSIPKRAYLRSKENDLGVIKRYSFANDADNGRFSRATESDGSVTENVLDDQGRLIERRVDGELIERWRYGDNRVTHIDSAGNETIVDRNRYGEVVHRKFPDGAEESRQYNAYGQVTRLVDGSGVATTYEHDDNGNIVRRVEAVGTSAERVTTYQYDQYGQLTRRERHGTGSTPVEVITWSYDDYGNIRSRTDPAGSSEFYDEYNARGDLLKWRDRSGETWRADFDLAGNRTSLTNPLGEVSRREYDKAGQLIAEIDPLENRYEYHLDAAGAPAAIRTWNGGTWNLEYSEDHKHIVKVTDPDGVVYGREYNSAGRASRLVEPDGEERLYTYGGTLDNARSFQIASMEGPWRTVEYRYDSRGRRTAVIETANDGSLDSRVTRYDYDHAGRVASVTDPDGEVTKYEYDALGRRTRVIDPAGNAIEYTYNYQNNVTSFRDERKVVLREHRYNARGERIETRLADGSVWKMRYNDVGLKTVEIDAKGQAVRTIHDAAGRPKRIEYFASEAEMESNQATRVTALDSDARGRIVGFDNGEMSGTYTYDEFGRRIGTKIDFGPFMAEYSSTFTDGGRPRDATYPDGTTVSYEYDAAGRIEAIQQPDGSSISYQYSGRTIQEVLPGGSRNSWTYDSLGRVDRIEAVDPAGNILESRDYAYDAVDNIVSINTRDGKQVYSYDQRGQLTGVERPNGPSESYTYDAAGNRIGSAATEGVWQYNTVGELQEADGVSYAYDDNGALITRSTMNGTTEYSYNVKGRLTSVDTLDGTVASYRYSPTGHRLSRTVNGVVEYYLPSADGPIAVFDQSGDINRLYGWSPHGRADIDITSPVDYTRDSSSTTLEVDVSDDGGMGANPLWVRMNGSISYYITDHIGTAQKLVSQSGAIQWDGRYSGFELSTTSVASRENRLRFPGQIEDREEGLYYNRNRYYQPESGRYIRRDPIRAEPNDYVYARNNPLKYRDPSGLSSLSIGGSGACQATAGTAGAGASGGGGVTIGDGAICKYEMICTVTEAAGLGGGCGVSVQGTYSNGTTCSGTSAKTVTSANAAVPAAGGSVSKGSAGSGECASESYAAGVGVKGTPTPEASVTENKCVINTDCFNEPECCDVPCECGGCG